MKNKISTGNCSTDNYSTGNRHMKSKEESDFLIGVNEILEGGDE